MARAKAGLASKGSGGGGKVFGDKEVLRNLTQAKKLYPEALAAAILGEAIALKARISPLIPVDKGVLKRSLYHTEPTSKQLSAEVGVGTSYALAQHENTWYHHLIGQAKYIEVPFNALRRIYPKRLAHRAAEYARKNIRFKAREI